MTNKIKTFGSEIGTNINPFAAYATEKVVRHYTLPVLSNIETAEDFIAHVSILNQASEDDQVTVQVNSLGGSLGAVDYLLSAMENCEARIRVEATGYLMSAATLIPMYADEIYISDNCEILIHNCSWGNGGKHSDVMEYALYTDKMNKMLLERYYGDMFSPEEMADLYKGKQFYMTNVEYMERYQKQHEIRMKRFQESYEEAEQLEVLNEDDLKNILEEIETTQAVQKSKKAKK